MSAFIINASTLSIVGFVQNFEIASEKAGQEHFVVNVAADLENLSLQQLTDIYNSITNQSVSKFKIARDKAAVKVFSVLNAIDTATLVQLDAEVDAEIETQVDAEINAEIDAEIDAEIKTQIKTQVEIVTKEEVNIAVPTPIDTNGKKIRKIRDSKLQRMKAAFLSTNEDGSFKQWSVKELMEKCGTTERITHVYISILRSPSDRFIMNIEKLPFEAGAAPQFLFKPKVMALDPQAPEQSDPVA